MVVSFSEADGGDPHALDATLLLRDSLPQPDLSPLVGGDRGITIDERGSELLLSVAGDIEREQAAEIEEAIWAKLHFASHLRSERLGQFTIGNDLHRSESLGVVQLLILYHVVTARAAVALGGVGPRGEAEGAADDRDPATVES
jgi:phosphoribulokinase